jgi:hypothetical protein
LDQDTIDQYYKNLVRRGGNTTFVRLKVTSDVIARNHYGHKLEFEQIGVENKVQLRLLFDGLLFYNQLIIPEYVIQEIKCYDNKLDLNSLQNDYPTFTSEKLLQYVNEAMADHNDGKQGWAALKQKIRNEPKFNKDPQTLKRAWQSASKLFQQKLDEIGGVEGKFKEDSGFNVGVGNGLPHKDRSPKPGGEYTTKLPDSGPIPGGAYNTPSNRGMNVRPKFPVKQ